MKELKEMIISKLIEDGYEYARAYADVHESTIEIKYDTIRVSYDNGMQDIYTVKTKEYLELVK